MAAAGKAEAGNGACTGIKNGVSLKAGSGLIPGSGTADSFRAVPADPSQGAASCRLRSGNKGPASCFR